MSSKRNSKKTQAPEASPVPEATTGRGGPSTLAIGVAILGLAALVFALVVTGDPPERRRRSVATASYVDQWRAAPAQDVGVTGRDFAVGPEDAPVTIVTFSDFECPYCKDASVTLSNLYERFTGDVRVVFKNYPLDQACNAYMPRSNHLYSCRAAAMARCAGAQDRFWEMHDAIFGLEQINLTTLDGLAEEIGLASDAFTACMQDERIQSDVKADIEDGKRLGVNGTPTIFVNGRKTPSPTPEAIGSIVENVLSEPAGAGSSGGGR